MSAGAEHEGHLRHQRQGQRGGNPEAAQLLVIHGELARLFLGTRVVAGNACREAGLDHRRHQLLRIGQQFAALAGAFGAFWLNRQIWGPKKS